MAKTLGRTILGLLGALGLGSCGDGPVSQTTYVRTAGSWNEFVYASSDGPVLVEIRNNPWGIGREMLEGSILSAMEGAIGERIARYTTDPAQAPHANYRVILLFQPPKMAGARELCANEPIAVQPASEPGRLDLLAAFCHKGEKVAEVVSWARKITGPEDRRFELLIGQTTRHLFLREGRSVP
jgi:hypothetical protein